MSSAGRDRGQEGGRDADHLTPQFLITNQKHWIEKISRMEVAMVGRNQQILEEKGIIIAAP
jgi:hypothetical protein